MTEISYVLLVVTAAIVIAACWGCWHWGYQIGHIDGEFEARKEHIDKFLEHLRARTK